MNTVDEIVGAHGLKSMNDGQSLQVFTTDPGAVKDIKAFCVQTSHTLVLSQESDNEHIFVIRKS